MGNDYRLRCVAVYPVSGAVCFCEPSNQIIVSGGWSWGGGN